MYVTVLRCLELEMCVWSGPLYSVDIPEGRELAMVKEAMESLSFQFVSVQSSKSKNPETRKI